VLDDDRPGPVGLVPLEGRGSLPFLLLRGESLVAVASWCLGEAGVHLLDFTLSWADVQAHGAELVVHDPVCPGTPVEFLREAVAAAADGDVVVGVRPVTDTVKHGDDEVLGETVDRAGLRAVCSPVVLPASVVAALPEQPDLADLADLVVTLAAEHPVRYLEAPPSARRVVDASDVRLLEALLEPEG
jgi:2-C-methyl-D-erythritol 4-phosphate cytidylyltransferase